MYETIWKDEDTAALRRIKFHLVRSTDGVTPATNAQITAAVCQLSANGGAVANSTNNLTEIDATNMPGAWYLELTVSELTTMGVGNHRARFKEADCLEAICDFQVVSDDIMSASPTTAQMAAAVLAATNAELASLPGTGSVAFGDQVRLLYQYLRNRVEQDGSEMRLYKADGSTELGASAVTDNGTTVVRGALA